jgi:hypothetical protein
MRKNTNRLMGLSWELVANNSELNGFASRKEFEEEFGTLGEVAGDGRNSFFTRISAKKPFESGNVQIVNVEDERDEEKIIVPFAGGTAG